MWDLAGSAPPWSSYHGHGAAGYHASWRISCWVLNCNLLLHGESPETYCIWTCERNRIKYPCNIIGGYQSRFLIKDVQPYKTWRLPASHNTVIFQEITQYAANYLINSDYQSNGPVIFHLSNTFHLSALLIPHESVPCIPLVQLLLHIDTSWNLSAIIYCSAHFSVLPTLYTPHSFCVLHPFHILHQLPLETRGT